MDLNGTWREWSNVSTFTTLSEDDGGGGSGGARVVDPQCEEGGVTLTAQTGTIEYALPRSAFSSDCWWKIEPAGLDPSREYRLLLTFEPHSTETSPFSIGERVFSPVPADSVDVRLGVAGRRLASDQGGNQWGYASEGAGYGNPSAMGFDTMYTCSMSMGTMSTMGLTDAISRIEVVSNGESGCADTAPHLVSFSPDNDAVAYAIVVGGVVDHVRLDCPGR